MAELVLSGKDCLWLSVSAADRQVARTKPHFKACGEEGRRRVGPCLGAGRNDAERV